MAELELGVGDDDAPLGGMVAARRVERNGQFTTLLGQLAPDDVDGADRSEMFSSWRPSSAFVDGVNDGLGQLARIPAAAGSGVPCMVPSRLYSFQADP